MTLHGSLIGLNDSVQGRGEQEDPMPTQMRPMRNMQIFGGR